MRLSVEGYKSILEKQSINLEGLAVISGANSTGKSSFMQPFLILKQTIENNTDGSSLVINGENTNLTESNQILNKIKNDGSFSVFVKSKEGKNIEEAKSTFKYNIKNGFSASEAMLFKDKSTIKITKKMNNESIMEEANKFEDAENFLTNNIFKNLGMDEGKFHWTVATGKPFLTLELTLKNKEEKKLNFSIGFNPNKRIEDFVENIIHVPGIRSNPERQYKIERYTTKYQGRFDKYIASIIYNWCNKKDKKLAKLIEILKELGLASNIEAKKINEAHISIDISRKMTSDKEDTVNLSDVGFGISQILPAIVALIEAKEKNTVFIEQPEIHLHPQAQFKLAKIICDFVKSGKKVIVETHSSIFIRGLQIEVAEKNLQPNLFSLNWFSQDDSGNTHVSEANLDENGAFGEWPADFDDTYLYVEDRYLNAVEKNMFLELDSQKGGV